MFRTIKAFDAACAAPADSRSALRLTETDFFILCTFRAKPGLKNKGKAIILMNSDILIIGGGIIGLATARALYKKGVSRITIVERGGVGKEASHAAAGMLAPNAETEKPDDFFHLCNESNKLYTEFAAELLHETNIDVELDKQGTLY